MKDELAAKPLQDAGATSTSAPTARQRVDAMLPGMVTSFDAPGGDWSIWLLELRRQLHEVGFRWGMAASEAPVFDGAHILPDVALILQVVERFASDADIAIRRRGEAGVDQVELAQRGKVALEHLATIAAVVRKVIRYPVHEERIRQARELKRWVGEYLAENAGPPDAADLAQGFVRLVWVRRLAPLTRYLTEKRMLVGLDEQSAIEKVRRAIDRLVKKDALDEESCVRVGLRALGIPASTVKNIFDPDRKAFDREKGRGT